MPQSNIYRRRQLDKARSRSETLVERAVAPIFKARLKQVERELRKQNLRKRLAKNDGELLKAGVIPGWREWSILFRQTLRNALTDNSDSIWKVEERFFRSNGYRQVRIRRQDVLNEYFQRDADTRIDGIGKTTEQKVNETIARWFNTDQSLPDLIALLGQWFDENRARLIATTELAYVSSQYATSMMQDYGIEKWTWDAFQDAHTCDVCMDLMVQSKRTPFSIGDPMPPDLSHPGCRCGVYFVGVDIKR